MTKTKANKKHKDRLFKKIFESKENLLSLYNAINGTDYTNPDDIKINTLEDFIYVGFKNDVSFLIANVMNLYEHQSTINPNMPLRGFLYFAKLYSKLFKNHADLYSSRQIPLPMPQFIIFYNGEENEPDRRIMKMSDAFAGKLKENAALECTATLLNINYGHNKELMQKCRKLEEYAILINRIRENTKAGMTKEEAIDKAVDDCIENGVLSDILETHRAEAITMIMQEYYEELHLKSEKAISYEDGLNDGMERGRKIGLQEGIQQGIQQGLKQNEAERKKLEERIRQLEKQLKYTE